MTYTVTTPATDLAVSVASAKAALNIDAEITIWDQTIQDLIKAGTEMAEHQTGRVLMTQSIRFSAVDWPTDLILLRAPVASVTSVKYHDGSAWQTIDPSAYVVWQDGLLTRIDPVSAWPSLGSVPGHRVRVDFVGGYASADLVPAAIKRWIIAQVGAWLKNPESTATKLEPNPAMAGMLDGERLYT